MGVLLFENADLCSGTAQDVDAGDERIGLWGGARVEMDLTGL